MIKVNELIALFEKALMEKWGYIWGAAGETWTQAKQNAATREQTKKYGQKWVDKRVADCSGLFYWAFKQLGGYMYHGSNTMFKKYTTASGKLKAGLREDGKPLKPGTALFQYNTSDGYHHVGLYVGNNKVIEAKGTYYGVTTSTPANWSHWGELKDVAYDETYEEEIKMEFIYTATVTTASGSLNLRKSPKNGAIITRLARNSTVDVYLEQDGWMFVKQGGHEGWVSGEYLTKNATSDGADEKTEGGEEILDTAEVCIVITDSEGNTFKPVGKFTVDMVVSTENGEYPV